MTSSIPHTVALICHPGTPSRAVRGIRVRVSRVQGGSLALTFSLKGDLVRVRVPPPRPPRRADCLWQHTCFEVFVAVKGGLEYREFNFAPSGEWAGYAFQRYRDGAQLKEDLAPGIIVSRAEDRLELEAVIHLDRLPTTQPRARLKLALCAVVEEENGLLSYWALRHPPGKPDFHHPDAFALEIEPPNVDVVDDPAQTWRP